ncbi:MAZ protein, partial [Larus smithsonianus]|nr:MAZ protein [Larus smithsonianus]
AEPPPQPVVPVPPVPPAQRKARGKGPYVCSLCAKEFKNGYNLRRHEAIHSGSKTPRPPAAAAAMKMPTMVPLSLLSVAGGDGGGGGG